MHAKKKIVGDSDCARPCGASMAARAALIGALATLWRVRRSLVCVTAPTDGRELSRPQVSAESAHHASPSAHVNGAEGVADLPARVRPTLHTHQHPFRAHLGRLLPAGLGPERPDPRPALSHVRRALLSALTVLLLRMIWVCAGPCELSVEIIEFYIGPTAATIRATQDRSTGRAAPELNNPWRAACATCLISN